MPNYTASHPGWFATMDSWPIILVNLPLSTCLLFSADSIITHTYSMITMVPLLHAQARFDHDTLCRPFARMRLSNILHNSVGPLLDYARDSKHSFDSTVRNCLRVSSVRGLVCGRLRYHRGEQWAQSQSSKTPRWCAPMYSRRSASSGIIVNGPPFSNISVVVLL